MLGTTIERRAVCAALLSLSLACGGGTQVDDGTTPVDVNDVPPAAVRPTATSLLPADSFALVEIDVARARQSSYFEMVWNWAVFLIEEEARSEAPQVIAALNQAVHDIDRITASFVPRGSRYDLGAIVVEGRFAPGEVEGWMRQVMPDEVEADLQQVQMGNYQGWQARDGALVNIDDTMFIIGPPERLSGPLANPSEPVAFADASFLSARSQLRVAEPILRATVLATEAGRHMLRYDSPLEGAAEQTSAAAIAFDASSGAQAHALALLETAETANGFVTNLARMRDELSTQMPLSMMPQVVSALRSIEFVNDGPVANIHFAIADSELRPLLETLDGFLRMARGGGPDTAAEPPPNP